MRTAVLTISTAAILLALLLGYRQLVVDPAPPERERGEAFEGLPIAHPPGAEGSLRVGAVEVPPGGQIIFTVYDPHTGRPTDRVRCEEWSSVPGTKNEIAVKKPELAMRLPSGLIATITADAGQLAVDRVQNTRMRPQHGWLRGGARIVIDRDREGGIDAPATTQPADDERIVITMDRLEFDLQLGLLRTSDRIQLESRDFEIIGEGLDLVWNQADNQVETLQIARGERLVLFGAGGFLGERSAGVDTPATDAPSSPNARSASGDRRAAAAADTRSAGRRKRGGATAYVCTLSGGVNAEHRRGGESLGRLVADDLQLTFDVGGGARDLLGTPRDRTTTTQPHEAREQLVVTWSGSLRLGPVGSPARGDKNRRRLEARGSPVVLTRGDSSIRCGRLEYYDESGQIWLYAPDRGAVELALRADLTARAGSIYVDRARDIVKLIGDVRLESHRATEAGATRKFAIRAAQWAELHVEPRPATDEVPGAAVGSDSLADGGVATRTRPAARDVAAQDAADALGFSGLRGATFVGTVVVDLGDQELRTHRLDTTFRKDAPDDSLEAALRTAVASGGAVLKARDERLECMELRLEFARSDSGEVYPHAVDAFGNVVIEQQQSSLRGGRVQAQLDAPPPKTAGSSSPAFVIRSLHVKDGAALDDPRNRVSARGVALDATFTADNQLDHAIVAGDATRPAQVRAAPYVVRGPRIEMSESAQTLQVAGRSELRFRSERGLQGERRARATPVIIRADRLLHVDGRGNVVRFVENVVAHSGDDELRADQLTITLEDIAPPAQSSRPRPRMDAWDLAVGAARALAGGEAPTLTPTAPPPIVRPSDGPRGATRKEIVRIKAENAVAQNETTQPGDPQPLVHSSLAAAVMDVDVVQRVIRTSGRTTLLMTNRRVSEDDSPGREALGLPSALITRGASQTAMQCDGSMTYVFGASGPQRQDNVLFEGGVVLVHKAGREMVNIDQMLPQLAGDKDALARMKSRNAYLECRRLEVAFAPAADGPASDASGLSARSNLRLHWLMASGDVYLRDKQGTGTRTVNADSIEFDRAHGLVRVLGTPSVDARVQFEDPAAGRFDQPAIGPLFIIDLQANTVRTDRVEGVFRRGGG